MAVLSLGAGQGFFKSNLYPSHKGALETNVNLISMEFFVRLG